jgi:hypothetical protein
MKHDYVCVPVIAMGETGRYVCRRCRDVVCTYAEYEALAYRNVSGLFVHTAPPENTEGCRA